VGAVVFPAKGTVVVDATVDVVVDRAIYVKSVFEEFGCPDDVTTTLAEPAVPAGVVHVIEVDDTTVTFVQAEPPTETVEPLEKFVPVIVIAVPPATGPDVGITEEIVGAGGKPILKPP
jgi:hypothetical protein